MTPALPRLLFSLDGVPDSGSGDISMLNDGRVPSEADAPSENFFFAQQTKGGRILADLHQVISVRQVNSYSWHPNTRAPQVYKLYGSDGLRRGFDPRAKIEGDPAKSGWKFLASIDTRSKTNSIGGQYGVSIAKNKSTLGKFRYLLFDISRTENDDTFGNTFFSEIDIVGKDDPPPILAATTDAPTNSTTVHSTDGQCEIVIQSIGDPALWKWVNNKLAPALAEWYPKIAALLPSEGFTPPSHLTVTIKPGRGVATTSGNRITANSNWLRRELNHEAAGSVIHEEVHVIQQYHGRRDDPDALPNPGWLVEGIADYVRFYKFEPETHGAEINERKLDRVHYDQSYRVTANFLNWVSTNYDSNIVSKLNAAMREGRYNDEIWPKITEKSVQTLGDEWKSNLQKSLPAK